MRYTQKQIDKFNRQKYIGELEKMSKNLFRMFRDQQVSVEDFLLKFDQLKKKFDEKEEVRLESPFHQQLKEYLFQTYQSTCLAETFTPQDFEEMREVHMSMLNRLQKLKNGTSYKKDKHKARQQNEDWGH